jgi:hypothetical protein
MTKKQITPEEEKQLKKLLKNTIDFKDEIEIIQFQNWEVRHEEIYTIQYWQGNKDKEHSFTINLN